MVGNLASIFRDPTLDAVDRAIEARAAEEPPRRYLGASSLGEQCERRSWYSLNQAPATPFKAGTLYKFADGHRTEALIIERLRMVPGVEVWDRDPSDPSGQIGGTLFDGKFGWHVDGVIKGLKQAPETAHVLEVKCVNPDKFKKFVKLREANEKGALMNWDYIYFVQAQIYMGMLDMKRHYLVVATPGGREMAASRTEFVPVHFDALMKKAERIIKADSPPPRIHEDPSYYECKWCRFREHCHQL